MDGGERASLSYPGCVVVSQIVVLLYRPHTDGIRFFTSDQCVCFHRVTATHYAALLLPSPSPAERKLISSSGKTNRMHSIPSTFGEHIQSDLNVRFMFEMMLLCRVFKSIKLKYLIDLNISEKSFGKCSRYRETS